MAQANLPDDILTAENPNGMTREKMLQNVLPVGTQTPSVTPKMTGKLVDYYDQVGNLQQLDAMYEQTNQIPTGWSKTNQNASPQATQTVTTPQQMSVADILLKNRQDQERTTQERQRLATEKAKSQLGFERENVLAKIGEQKATVEPRYGEARKQAVVGSTLATKRLADLIPFSGAMAGNQIRQGEAINTDLQNRQSALDIQKATELTDIASREQDTERNYQQGLRQAELGSLEQANESLARIQENYANRSLDEIIRQEGISREEAETLKQEAKQKVKEEQAIYLDTIDRFSKDYTQELENLQAQGVADNDYRVMALQSARAKKVAKLDEAQYQAQLQAIQDERERQETALERAQWRFENGMPADAITSQLLGVPQGSVIPKTQIELAKLELDRIKEERARQTAVNKANTPSTKGALTQYQSLQAAMKLLGEDATQEEVLALANQLQGGTAFQSVTPTGTDKPKVSPPSKKETSPAKATLDWLYKLRQASDLVTIGNFMNDKGNLTELNSIINNPTTSDDEKMYAEQILKDYKKYSTGGYITGR